MIRYNELTNSIYDSLFFEKPTSSFSLLEKQNTSEKLRKVDFVLSGNAINIKNGILSQTERGYNKINDRISFKKNCDGLVIVDKDENHYLVFIELKSGFNDVANKAIFQIASSYVRLKHYLSAIDTYNPSDYQEIGIIVSYPYINEVGDQAVMSRRESLIYGGYGTFINRCKQEFKNGREILMNSSDVEIDTMSITSSFQMNNLRVVNVQVPNGATTATVDLDNYLV